MQCRRVGSFWRHPDKCPHPTFPSLPWNHRILNVCRSKHTRNAKSVARTNNSDVRSLRALEMAARKRPSSGLMFSASIFGRLCYASCMLCTSSDSYTCIDLNGYAFCRRLWLLGSAIWEPRCFFFDILEAILALREHLGWPFCHLGSTLGSHFGTSGPPWNTLGAAGWTRGCK